MKLVMTLVVHDEADLVDAHIAYHLNAGVDVVLATDPNLRDATTDVLEAYAAAGVLRLFREQGESRESDWHTRMAQLAASEHNADWVISSRTDEFWWPRAEGLKDVLLPIPPRYAIVQALVRDFVASRGDGGLFDERMSVRHTLQAAGDRSPTSYERVLRPVFRADPDIVIGPDGIAESASGVPLRAWYPIEVFHIPERDADRLGDEDIARGLSSGALVADTRLREALRVLRTESEFAPGVHFALPEGGDSRLALHSPDVVEDAAYAVECAEVGEVDMTILERHVDDLERRIAWLEERFWPRVIRRLSRIGRRTTS